MNDQALYDRIVAQVRKDPFTGCWVWTGPTYEWSGNRKRKHVGRYGWISLYAATGGKLRTINAHRAMWLAVHGPLTRQQFVCHRCDFGLCVNPEHLFLGSAKDNARDMRDKVRNNNSQKTHCPKGHAYAEHGEEFAPNVEHYRKWRRCKLCAYIRARTPEFKAKARERARRNRQRRKAAA